MHAVAILDSFCVLTLFIALFGVLSCRKLIFKFDVKLVLLLLISFGIIYYGCLFLQWSGLSDELDPIEDLIGALIPIWWGFLFYSLIQRVREAVIEDSEIRYRSIVEDQTEHVCRFLPDTKLIFVNQACCRYYGRSCKEFIGKKFIQFIPQEEHELMEKHLRSFTPEDPVKNIEHRVYVDGKTAWFQWTDRAFFDKDGKIIEFQGVGRDITEQKLSENKIIQALHEKETLIKEIHHRVKNNMVLLYGLVTFQQESCKNNAFVHDALEVVKQRIQTMGKVHMLLYQAKNLSEIDFSEYIRMMTADVTALYNAAGGNMVVTFDLDPQVLDIDKAVPCGLIVNELLANISKHAFPKKKDGHITISLKNRRGSLKELIVRDNGVGIDKSVDPQSAETLGMKLIFMLAEQIDAEVSYENDRGAVFKMLFHARTPAAKEKAS